MELLALRVIGGSVLIALCYDTFTRTLSDMKSGTYLIMLTLVVAAEAVLHEMRK